MARVRKPPSSEENPVIRWKVALYIRLSKEDGNDESYSVTNQRHRLAAYLDNLMQEEKMELIGFYVDDGYTGTDSDRDGFQRMLEDIAAKKVNCVIVKDLSRLSRNYVESGHYLEYFFVKMDVRFISLELPTLDSYKNPEQMNSIAVPMQSVFNDNHCRETSIKVRGTFNAKRRRGEFIGGFAPYGYLKDPSDRHRFIVDTETAPIVRDIFHWFAYQGMSINGIVRKLIAMGIPSPTAYKRQKGMSYYCPTAGSKQLWSASGVKTILTNQVYLGDMVQGKQKVKSYKVHTRVRVPESEWFVVEGTHEPIIEKEIFEKAQELMRRDTRTAPFTGQLYPFSGFLRCADCGGPMGRRTGKGLVYYACKTYTMKAVCSRHSIRHDRLEKAVLEAIQMQVALIEDMAKLVEAINNAPARRNVSQHLMAALKLRRQELGKIAELGTGLYLDWKNGDITREEYHRMKKEFAEREERLQQDIANLEEENRDMEPGATSSNPCFEAFLKHRNIQTLDRGIVTELIKVIHIHEGGGLTIDFNFGDQHRRIVEFIQNSKRN